MKGEVSMSENTKNSQAINDISRDQLSEMDRIFVPKDLDDNLLFKDFQNYKKCGVKFWRSVPSNCRLVTENIFTRKPKFIDGTGFRLIPPLFTRTILVPGPELEGIKTFKDVKCLSKDKIEIGVDLSLSMSIVDPVKYIRKGKHQMEQLSSIVNRLLRIYVANQNFDTLVASECSISKFDLNKNLDNFTQENGIKVNKVIFEKAELSEELKKSYNDAAEEEQKRKAQEIKNKAALEKAENDAKIKEIELQLNRKEVAMLHEERNKAFIQKLTQSIDVLKSRGIPTDKIADSLYPLIASENESSTFIVGGNGQASDIAAGVAAGNRYSRKFDGMKDNSSDTRKTSKISNFDRFMQEINSQFMDGKITEEDYKDFLKLFKVEDKDAKRRNEDAIAQINAMSEEEYRNFLQNYGMNSEQQDGLKKRGR